MNWRWLALDDTDPELPLTLPERQALIRLAMRDWLSTTIAKMLYFGLMGMCVGIWFLAVWTLRSALPQAGDWVEMASMLIVMAFFLAGMAYIKRFGFSPILRRELRAAGFEVCVGCGYWLRALGELIDKCPECGAARQPMTKPPRAEDAR